MQKYDAKIQKLKLYKKYYTIKANISKQNIIKWYSKF